MSLSTSASRLRLTLYALLALAQWAWLFRVVPALHGNDFGIFYRSAASTQPYVGHPGNPTTGDGQLLTNLNPPHFLLVLKPFTLLPLVAACVVWWLLSLGLIVAGLTWWLRTQGERWTIERAIWAALWAPVLTMGFTGQVTAVLGVAVWLAYRNLRRGHDWRGGAWLGLVLSVKPILWPLAIWFVVRREWKAVFGMAAAGAASVAIGLAVFGLRTYWMWIGALRGIDWGQEAMNASISGIASRLPIHVPHAASLLVGFAVACTTVWRSRGWTLDRAWMPLVAASLLASPLGWVYYGVWLLPGTSIAQWTKGVARFWCAPLIVVIGIGNLSAGLWASVGCCYGWTLLAMWYRSGVVRTAQVGPLYRALHPSASSRWETREVAGTNAHRIA